MSHFQTHLHTHTHTCSRRCILMVHRNNFAIVWWCVCSPLLRARRVQAKYEGEDYPVHGELLQPQLRGLPISEAYPRSVSFIHRKIHNKNNYFQLQQFRLNAMYSYGVRVWVCECLDVNVLGSTNEPPARPEWAH